MVASVAGNGKSPQQVMLREQVRAMILDAIRLVVRTVRRRAPPCPSRMEGVVQVDVVV